MSDYSYTTNFAAKDALSTGNAAKVVKGSDFGFEFDKIVVAIATKYDAGDNAAFGTLTATGTVTFDGACDIAGALTALSISGGTF